MSRAERVGRADLNADQRRLRIAFGQFLSAESPGLMGSEDLGEFKFSAIERFRGILHAAVKASLRTDRNSRLGRDKGDRSQEHSDKPTNPVNRNSR
jgi:hypothetical protein